MKSSVVSYEANSSWTCHALPEDSESDCGPFEQTSWHTSGRMVVIALATE
jgi:hypothetical protein